MAARNSDGIVIAQVERVVENGSLNPRLVTVPGIMVDCVVVAKTENHWQTFATPYNPAFSNEIRVRTGSLPPIEMSERKIIARRCAFRRFRAREVERHAEPLCQRVPDRAAVSTVT